MQVLVRGNVDDPQPAKLLLFSIFPVFAAIHNTVVNGVRYQRVDCLQTPFPLQKDADRRMSYAFNIEAFKDV